MPSFSRMRDQMLDLMTQRRAGLPSRPDESQGDIELPNSGRRDPRLPPEAPDVLGAMGTAAKGYRTVKDTFANMERARDRGMARRR